MVKRLYNMVMDPEQNPLQALPKMVRFQYMIVLAYMWSVIFAMYIGAIAMVGPSIAAHTILLVGVFFTADIFRRSRQGGVNTDFDQAQSRVLSYDMQFKDSLDGGARFDDVWGAPDTIARRPLHQG